jgi:putative peptidoglycan lipid II flippase
LWLAAAQTPVQSLHGVAQAAVLLSLIGGGIALYGLLLRLFGVTGWREAVDAIRQNPPRDLRD